jgi:hypothetical protein
MCNVIVQEGRGHESSKQGEGMMPRKATGRVLGPTQQPCSFMSTPIDDDKSDGA